MGPSIVHLRFKSVMGEGIMVITKMVKSLWHFINDDSLYNLRYNMSFHWSRCYKKWCTSSTPKLPGLQYTPRWSSGENRSCLNETFEYGTAKHTGRDQFSGKRTVCFPSIDVGAPNFTRRAVGLLAGLLASNGDTEMKYTRALWHRTSVLSHALSVRLSDCPCRSCRVSVRPQGGDSNVELSENLHIIFS